ncbi:MAG: restriction endonuclease, partial [Chloroflexi bacterium]
MGTRTGLRAGAGRFLVYLQAQRRFSRAACEDPNHRLRLDAPCAILTNEELVSAVWSTGATDLTPPGPSRPDARKRDGMQSKTLFSNHYLENRLPDHPEWDEDAVPVFEAVRELWQHDHQHGDSWNESQTEQEFIQPALELLGWAYVAQPQAHQAGRVRRPDYALFPDQVAKDDAMPHQGDDAAFYAQVPTIAEAKYWGRPLSQKDAGGREKWDAQTNPSHQMVSYLVGTHVPWGVLTNGVTWRLYSREVSSTASEFYEVDLSAIFDSLPTDGEPIPDQLDRFRRWWLFFRRDAFVPDAQGRCFVERVHAGSTTYARRISDVLKELVYEEVMPQIAGGFVAYRHHQMGVAEESEESLRQIYRASLSLLYKLLFLLYGEARALLPVDNPGYREQSLTRMAQWAAERLDRGLPISDATHATARYDALLALFHRVDRGDPSLGIPRYDGGLFDPSSPENQFLEQHKLSDRAVARSVDTLVRDAGEPVDYAYIGVQNLGSIYEGLLENRLRVVDGASGAVELIGDKGERKATGSYYTPDYIVEYIVQHTLDPILEERDAAFRAAMERCVALRRQLQDVPDAATARRLRGELEEAEREAREAFLGIKVLDPAMGSGHFLVNAVDHLTDAIIRRMQVYHDEHPDVPWDWNPIQRMIERTREAILTEMERQHIQVDAARLDDTALLTRLVMKRCIYGVDLNRMAVELAKVSLWLHTFTVGAPLSFLDHHLRWGNSLIGTDVRTVEQEIQATEAGQMSLWQGPFAGLLDLTGLMVEVVERADATLADVQQSAEDFQRFRDELTPYKQVLDLWVSQYFGNQTAYEFLTLYGEDVLPALKGQQDVPEEYEEAIERARALYEEKRFFHWDLEFPEVFVDLRSRDWAQNPGFDAVIGNPPYERIQTIQTIDPIQARYFAEHFESATGKYDIYVIFIEQAVNVVRKQGGVSMILPHKFTQAHFGHGVRRFIHKRKLLDQLLSFGTNQAFSDATTYTCLLFLKEGSDDTWLYYEMPDVRSDTSAMQELLFSIDDRNVISLPKGSYKSEAWILSDVEKVRVLETMRTVGQPLKEFVDGVFQGVVTGLNDAFILEMVSSKASASNLRRVFSSHTSQVIEVESEILRPFVKGKGISRYRFIEPTHYLLYPYHVTDQGVTLYDEGIIRTKFPRAYEYLSGIREDLENRGSERMEYESWYALWNPRNPRRFSRSKILAPDICYGGQMSISTDGRLLHSDTTYAILPDRRLKYGIHYLLAILNSQLLWFFLTQIGTPLRGGYYRYKT